MKPTRAFRQQIGQAWSDPHKVAEICMEELVRQTDGPKELSHAAQIKFAIRIGLLAGEADGRARFEDFLDIFEKEILNDALVQDSASVS